MIKYMMAKEQPAAARPTAEAAAVVEEVPSIKWLSQPDKWPRLDATTLAALIVDLQLGYTDTLRGGEGRTKWVASAALDAITTIRTQLDTYLLLKAAGTPIAPQTVVNMQRIIHLQYKALEVADAACRGTAQDVEYRRTAFTDVLRGGSGGIVEEADKRETMIRKRAAPERFFRGGGGHSAETGTEHPKKRNGRRRRNGGGNGGGRRGGGGGGSQTSRGGPANTSARPSG
jgi:hypothetical protein